MKLTEAIERSKNYNGMKVDFSGAMRTRQGGSYIREEVSKHFDMARKAWLEGDLETVSQFFGIYV